MNGALLVRGVGDQLPWSWPALAAARRSLDFARDDGRGEEGPIRLRSRQALDFARADGRGTWNGRGLGRLPLDDGSGFRQEDQTLFGSTAYSHQLLEMPSVSPVVLGRWSNHQRWWARMSPPPQSLVVMVLPAWGRAG